MNELPPIGLVVKAQCQRSNGSIEMLPAVLRLTVTKHWFDMIASGEKKEEYRELKPYWGQRFSSSWCKAVKVRCTPPFKSFDYVEFKNGYSKNAPTLLVECNGITVGKPKQKWCLQDAVYFDEDNGAYDDCFVIALGKIVMSKA